MKCLGAVVGEGVRTEQSKQGSLCCHHSPPFDAESWFHNRPFSLSLQFKILPSIPSYFPTQYTGHLYPNPSPCTSIYLYTILTTRINIYLNIDTTSISTIRSNLRIVCPATDDDGNRRLDVCFQQSPWMDVQ